MDRPGTSRRGARCLHREGREREPCGGGSPHPFDLDEEVDRLVALGAQRVDWRHYAQSPPLAERPYVVQAGPEGNRFCVKGQRAASGPPWRAPCPSRWSSAAAFDRRRSHGDRRSS
ncbi:VOC family protein [Streptomyces sp. NPDC057438]|uniref:VOC family protein n=1 Tax=Streptomyces sp. NPDC057438 TaxID=3346133 RepID=UPI00369376F2